MHAGNVLKANDDKLVVIDQLQPSSQLRSEGMLPQVRAGASSKLPSSRAGAGQERKSAEGAGAISGEKQTGCSPSSTTRSNQQTGQIRLKRPSRIATTLCPASSST